MKIAVSGLGKMGMQIAQKLTEAGHEGRAEHHGDLALKMSRSLDR